jgi:hypothetical protein
MQSLLGVMSKKLLNTPSSKTSFTVLSLLAVSLCLNLGLGLSLLLRASNSERRPVLSKFIPAKRSTNSQIIHLYESLSLGDLIHELRNHTRAEEGFTYSDLALGCLVARHHFDLVRALPGKEHMLRYLAYTNVEGQEKTLQIYLGLTESEKELVHHFATSHKWPLDSFGLFLKLKERPGNKALVEAFSRTQEFRLIFEAMKSFSEHREFIVRVAYQDIIYALTCCPWEEISMLAQRLRGAASNDVALKALYDFAISATGDKLCEILLEAASSQLAKQAQDTEVVQLMKKFTSLSPTKVRFATKLLFSQRSDEVHYYAATLIALAAKKTLPEPFDRIEALKLLFPTLVATLEK